jgi:hypothetical protein
VSAIEGRAVFILWGICPLSVFWHPKASGEVTEEACFISLFNDSHVNLFDENWAREVAGVMVNMQLGKGASGVFL